mgnify:CR=1 FL=1
MPANSIKKVLTGLLGLLPLLAALLAGLGGDKNPEEPAPPSTTVSTTEEKPAPSEPQKPEPSEPSEPSAPSEPSEPPAPAPEPAPEPPAPEPSRPAPPAPEPPAPEKPAPTPDDEASEIQRQLIDATNKFREQNGLPALKPMPELNRVAQDWSERMAREDNLYHNPSYTQQYPSGWTHASENVLQNMTSADAAAMVDQWAKSPGHRANMLSPEATHIGVGVADTGNGKRYATQNFAGY